MTRKISLMLLTGVSLMSVAFAASWASAQEVETQARTYSYDKNRNGYIEPEEFTTYLYTRSDVDGDGYMGDEDWQFTTSRIYKSYKDIDYNKYTYWDQDKDGRLDTNEVKTLVEKTGIYAKWDTNLDGKIDNKEFSKGTFTAYDDDNNGLLDLAEWGNVLR